VLDFRLNFGFRLKFLTKVLRQGFRSNVTYHLQMRTHFTFLAFPLVGQLILRSVL